MKKLVVEYDLVIVIDALTEKERGDFKLSEDLIKFLAKEGIKQMLFNCDDKKSVNQSLSNIQKVAESGLKFCLHFVSHGNEKGIWIKNSNETISWEEFRESLYHINRLLSNTLIINMTSCFGLNAIKIVNDSNNENPFFGLIGSNRVLWTNEAYYANRQFYTKLLAGKDISVIIPEMQNQFRIFGKDNVIFGASTEGYKSILKYLKS
ncbi:hypothetical protein K3G39_20150 [Pontibacter sp. HSC-14F20]|uniref:hypothetical protein n=1 Tax=Pontibacter sp. HSC-14F20 TaxID=2864136 RepID=UPI001C73C922|nr:hypothetical protein [Pontibacter sp. HSC-14F20]MBX0335550.1 hypothetical protein [Pontibacter sp. HSC-14F20]